MNHAGGISGTQCEVCDNVIILFSCNSEEGEEKTVITVDCYRCEKTHEVPFDDLVEDVVPLCCGREVLPNEFDDLTNDFVLSIICAKCGADNEVSVDIGLNALKKDAEENHLALQ